MASYNAYRPAAAHSREVQEIRDVARQCEGPGREDRGQFGPT